MASDKNVAKIVKLQEKIKVELKNLIKEAMQSGMSREDVDASAKEMIQKFLKDNKDVKLEYNKLYKMWVKLLYNNFTTMYKISFKTLDRELNKDKISQEVSQALKELYKSDTVKKESYVFKSNDLIDDKNINASDTPNLKFIRTSAEYGYTQMQIDNYVEKVERTMDKIAQINFVAVNSTGARVSLRNKAEMEVRYQDMLSDLNKLKDEKFVIVSQHRDSSLRCACWQGLIYLKDTDGTDVSLKNWHEWNNIKNHIVPKPIGYTKDNQPYYSLKEAMEHGLFSYNCRHRFIKYEPGIKVPKQYPYDPNKESASSLIDKQMRQLEQNIRRAKERQTLALTPKELKKWQAKSKRLQAEYNVFCKKHNRVRNDWRTSIGVVERGATKQINNIRKNLSGYITRNENEDRLDEVVKVDGKERLNEIDAIEKELSPKTKDIIKILDNAKVEKREVRKLAEPLSDFNIISKVGGVDNSLGSCASLALSYIANKMGYDVTDYRGGSSQFIFSDPSTLDKIVSIEGLSKFEEKAGYDYLFPNQIFDKCWEQTIPEKEYLVVTGEHAAIVRDKGNKRSYLELQLEPNENGWKKWSSETLTRRFNCSKKCDSRDKCVVIDIESFKNIEFDFVNILSYINTRNYDD